MFNSGLTFGPSFEDGVRAYAQALEVCGYMFKGGTALLDRFINVLSCMSVEWSIPHVCMLLVKQMKRTAQLQ